MASVNIVRTQVGATAECPPAAWDSTANSGLGEHCVSGDKRADSGNWICTADNTQYKTASQIDIFNSYSAYSVGEYVKWYDDTIYQCIQAVSHNEEGNASPPDDGVHWSAVEHGPVYRYVGPSDTGANSYWTSYTPDPGQNEIDTVSLPAGIVGGTFTITVNAVQCDSAYYDTSASDLQTFVLEEALGVGQCSVSGGPGPSSPWVIEFTGTLAAQSVSLSADGTSLVGATPLEWTPDTLDVGVELPSPTFSIACDWRPSTLDFSVELPQALFATGGSPALIGCGVGTLIS